MSMVDEFAKYAKLQRKANALKEQLKTESTALQTASIGQN